MDCEESARPGFMEVSGCFRIAPPDQQTPDCVYCLPSGHYDPSARCVLETFVVGEYGTVQLCNTSGRPVFRKIPEPQLQVHYAEGQSDASGSDASFIVGLTNVGLTPWHLPSAATVNQDTWRFYLAPTDLMVDMCGLIDYWPPAPLPTMTWVCRWFIDGGNAAAWVIRCNRAVLTTENAPNDDQLQPRLVRLPVDTLSRQAMFVRFVQGDDGDCFSFSDQKCFSDACAQFDNLWPCMDTYPERARALDRLFIYFSGIGIDETRCGEGQAFPHENVADVTIKNLALAKMAEIVEQLDSPGHNSGGTYDRLGLSRWIHDETFDASVGQPVAFPPVTDTDGAPLQLTCREWITKTELPAQLTLHRVNIRLYAHVEGRMFEEPQADPEERFRTLRRTFGTIDVLLFLRVKLLAEAYAIAAERGLVFVEPDDPFDLRIEDPQHPGFEHPSCKLIVRGPQGEKVPRTVRWRGARLAYPYARGGGYEDACYIPSFGSCCAELHAIENMVIFGELNDHSEEIVDGRLIFKPQRYKGAVSFVVPGLNPETQSGATFGCQCG